MATREQPRRLLVASPRGFCAGVERAIEVVDRLLARAGETIHVRREIVHNRAVVEEFRRRGAVFVDELDQVPRGSLVVFSAHGVSPAVRREAAARKLRVVDATCPLVTRVHREVVRHVEAGRHVILIGHPGHDEVLGTMGEAEGAISLLSSVEEARRLEVPPGRELAYVTQTTLSVSDTEDIVAELRRRFPRLIGPSRSDICYATQNRQEAVGRLVEMGARHLLVVGSPNSSNSRRLCEVARGLGAAATLVEGPRDLPWGDLDPVLTAGLTAGASAPERLVQEVTAALTRRGWVVEEVAGRDEQVHFPLPIELETHAPEPAADERLPEV